MWRQRVSLLSIAVILQRTATGFVRLSGSHRVLVSPFPFKRSSTRNWQTRRALSSSDTMAASTTTRNIVDKSTLTLLEHVNINVPSHEYILPFYFELLGCGMDPRKANNLLPDAAKQTLWANCGASQFHLPYGETAQVIPGHIGLSFQSLEGLKSRLPDHKECIQESEIGTKDGREYVRLVDRYNNVFVCRQDRLPERRSTQEEWSQPFISNDVNNEDLPKFITQRFGRERMDCSNVDYVEFKVPPGTADRIALFYDSVLDATTAVIEDNSNKVAMVAFGNVDDTGRADQALLFRECLEPTPPYDGHHVAMYVGESGEDFERAFANAMLAGVVWVNPRFSDKADDLAGARKWKQFRFKDILDMETGEKIFELEHEIRSRDHEAWPGNS